MALDPTISVLTDFWWQFTILQITNIVKQLYGKQFKLPNSESPKWLIYLIGPIFGVTRRFVKRNIGYPLFLNNEKSKENLGIEYTTIKNTIDDMIKSLLEFRKQRVWVVVLRRISNSLLFCFPKNYIWKISKSMFDFFAFIKPIFFH